MRQKKNRNWENRDVVIRYSPIEQFFFFFIE